MLGENDHSILHEVGECIEDPNEETFVLFSQDLPQNDLGILDNQARELDIDVGGHEYSIVQSSGLLNSERSAGTTGAMLWKVTPRLAQWLSLTESVLWKSGILDSSKVVLELGCGVAGLIGMVLSPLVASYVLTDQPYVLKVLMENLERNKRDRPQRHNRSRESKAKHQGSYGNLYVMPYDWEQDSVKNFHHITTAESGFDVVLICDCIYNTFLIEPLTQTCIEVCQMNPKQSTTIVVAQQLRTDDVFEQWLTRFLEDFKVWRVKDTLLPTALQSSSGYVVHLAMLRSNHKRD